jgi:serine/threonine protein kinase/Tfp pilus assembly protein PilF
MSAIPTIAGETTCRLCHESIGPDDSHRGYCFGCLLVPALDLDDGNEHDQNGWFDPYEILTHPDGAFIELGRGSMGITYEALDTTLQFPVALKVIDLKAAGLEANRERFLREARAAARLRHPHVASVLYYGVRKDGQCFYAMELVDGETLAERVQRQGPMPVKDALEVIAQIAGALQAAEKFGLVHRDLKPANIMLVSGPGINVKVIDFGLAKLMGGQETADRITYNGFVGTPAFASPEQFSGEQIDQRSDYFSLGSTLYYLISGKPPSKIDRLNESTKPIIDLAATLNRLKAAGIPSPVRSLLSALLSANPVDRPRNGQALTDAVAKCQRTTPERTKRKSLKLLAVTSVTLLIGGLVLFVNKILDLNTVQKSIAVLPFDNLGPMGDKAYFADGVQDEILTNLATVADLQVISRSSTQAYRNPATRPLPPEIGRALNVNYLVNGSVERTADRIRVTAQLVEARTGRQLWAERYDGELADVFTIQTQIAEVVSKELQAKLSSGEKASIEEAPTRDMTAYELYLHAKELLVNYDEATQGWDPLDSAVRLLNEAVSRDPNFALAWIQLAAAHDCAYWYNEDRSESRCATAENALHHALQLRPDLGEVHLEAGRHLLVTTHDYFAVRRELEIARRTLPNSASLFGLLADVDSHQGQWKDALQDNEKELALDPKNFALVLSRCRFYQNQRQYDELQKIFSEKTPTGTAAESINLEKAITAWQERGDTAALHSVLDEPTGPLRVIGRATLLKIVCALVDRNYAQAENCLAADPHQEFEAGDHLLVCRDFLLGYIKASEGDAVAARTAYTKARPQQLANVQKWPDDPNALMVLATTDAALGRKEDALQEGRQAVAMEPISQDAVAGPLLAGDLAQVYLLCDEQESAIKQLESLEQTPCALVYGDLAKLPEWDPLRSDPHFQRLLSRLKQPIPIVNHLPAQN